MARKAAKRPRPNKNSDGQDRKPSATRTLTSSPAPPPKAPEASAPAQPGQINPMTHPGAPDMRPPQPLAPAGPQVQERIQFKDLPPTGQQQTMQQLGMNPNLPQENLQQNVQQTLAGGASQGPVPNALQGPLVPPGVESFPDDMAHLTQLMQQGYSPGASASEHGLGMNADALVQARIQHAMQQAQSNPQAPMAPPAMGGGGPGGSLIGGPPPAGVPGVTAGGPQAGPSPQFGPPQAPGAPGGIPPELIAALVAEAKRKRKA
jgi:hypothetical protein